MDELKQDLQYAQAGLFSKRKTMQEALDYAKDIAKANGLSEAHMTTAIMVYHNTLLSVIGEGIDLLEKEAKA